MGHFFHYIYCHYIYFAIKMAENIDQEQVDERAMESSMEKQLNDSAALYLEQSNSIVREMTELKDQLEKQQAVGQEDPFFIPFLIKAAAKAAAIGVKAALAAKGVIKATAIGVKVAKAAKAGTAIVKATKVAKGVVKAAKVAKGVVKAAKVAKGAKMAKMAGKAAKLGKKAWKVAKKSRHIRKAARHGRKFARSRCGRALKRAGRKALRAGKKALKRRIKQEVNKWVDNYVEENFPELKPYMKDIKGVLRASRRGTKGLKNFLLKKAKAKINEILRSKGLP